MLVELRVRDFAIIDNLTARLRPGLNVLSGETGAGKSILVGALSLLLGDRASADVVRAGAERAVLEAVFDLQGRAELRDLLSQHGHEAEDDVLILKREVLAEGRSRAWINGSPATIAVLREIGQRLVDLHGQHEHQALLHAREQRSMLDAYAGASDLAGEVSRAWHTLRELETRIEALDTGRRELEQRAALLRTQCAEIEHASLRAGEEEELQAEAGRLEHAEELSRLSARLQQELYAADDAISGRLDGLRRTLDQLIRLDSSLEDARQILQDAFHGVQELGRRMGDYASAVEHDPARLDEIRRRQDVIFRLKARYGPDLSDVLETGRRARTELDGIDTAGRDRDRLAIELEKASAEYTRLAGLLTERRKAAAQRLQRAVNRALPSLALPPGGFIAALVSVPAGPDGAEQVEFRAALNLGADPAPLARVASGGELSRVMLALKSILARQDRTPSLVFDEIDAGIGGRIAQNIAENLARVARHHQVFVVTHLARIAARADHHLLVEKEEAAGGVRTVLRELEGQERVQELARMLGGDPDSEVSRLHAGELLEGAEGIIHRGGAEDAEDGTGGLPVR